MRRRYLCVVLVFLAVSSFLVIVSLSSPHALAHIAHNVVPLDTPTPTPDASAILQMAQQEEGTIQTVLNIINILIVVFPILIAGASVVVGVFGFRGFRSLEKQGQDLLEDI